MSSTVPPLPGRTKSKRTGERVVVLEDVFVNWRVGSPSGDAAAQKRRRIGPGESPDEAVGRMVDISATGTGIVAPTSDDLSEGSKVRIRLGASYATLRVVHFQDLEEDGWRLYGAEIVQADAEFLACINWWLTADQA